MSGALSHAAADVLRTHLIALGLGTVPSQQGSWPINVPNELASPDNTITIRNTVGRSDGRIQTGKMVEHEGVQIRVRSSWYNTGYAKIDALKMALDGIYDAAVTIDGVGYVLHSVSRTSGILDLGTDPSSKCELFTLNAVVTLQKS